MARLSKNELKKIVKECLFEILTEAAAPASRAQSPKPKRKRVVENVGGRERDSEFLANVKKSPSRKSSIDVSEITSDPIMAAIFEETARTTLVEQSKGERAVSAPATGQSAVAGMEHVPSDLSSTFGDSADKWADLAFASKISKK